MPSIKQIFWAIVIALGAVAVTGVVGFLSAAHLEISFDKLRDFDATDLKSYKALGTSVKFDFELSQPREFIAYWGENDSGRTVVRKSNVNFKNFKLSSKIQGAIVDETKRGPVSFGIVGYYNSERVVFSHRGPISGVGVYILNTFQIGDERIEAYAGHMIVEDIKGDNQNEIWLVQCPFIMLARDLGEKEFPTIEKAQEAFALLKTQCAEFKVPTRI
jgi:hypothetical protein